jgi:hypothetical protein
MVVKTGKGGGGCMGVSAEGRPWMVTVSRGGGI